MDDGTAGPQMPSLLKAKAFVSMPGVLPQIRYIRVCLKNMFDDIYPSILFVFLWLCNLKPLFYFYEKCGH